VTDLASCISEFGLDDHRAYLLGVARPAIEILTAETPVTPGCSKFNGTPDLPAGFEWPHHSLGPHRFFCQINLADVPSGPHGLPEDGLLSLFYAYDYHQEAWPGDPGYVRVYWFRDIETLTPVEPPASVSLGATATLAFRLGADVPAWPWDDPDLAAWPIDESLHDAYDELRLRLNPTGRYLLGYPPVTTMAYDPMPGPEWRELLTVPSNETLTWIWLDAYQLLTFIEERRLRAGDFSQIVAEAG
jgi:hypothetical protein